MSERTVSFLAFAAALGSGLIAGVFFTFSSFVMAALARLPPGQGVAAMQNINITVINPLFMGVFMGTAALCAALVAAAFMNVDGARNWPLLAGCAFYLIGSIGVTMAANVPLNNALAALDAGSAGAEPVWQTYLAGWTMWNHLRGAASLAACAAFIVALRASA